MNLYIAGALIGVGIWAARPIVHGVKKTGHAIVCAVKPGHPCAKKAPPAK